MALYPLDQILLSGEGRVVWEPDLGPMKVAWNLGQNIVRQDFLDLRGSLSPRGEPTS